MKKVILGTGLFICGVMGILASILKEAIFFASPNAISYETDLFYYIAIAFFLGGIALSISGLIEDKKK